MKITKKNCLFYKSILLSTITTLLIISCNDKELSDPKPNPDSHSELKVGEFTYKLNESTDNLNIWTTSVTNKVKSNSIAPKEQGSGIKICSAKNEFEPFQVILGKGSGAVTISMSEFKKNGNNCRIELNKVGFESGWAEMLEPINNGSSIQLSSSNCSPLFITIYVSENAISGTDSATLSLNYGNQLIDIPVKLHIFNFSLPKEIHFASQFNTSINGEADHTLLYEHRLTPKSPTWPSGFSYKITWPSPFNTFYDETDQQPEYGIKYLAAKYLHGEGWRGNGYPNGMAFQFVNNNTPRPTSFAGISIGTNQYGSTEYNKAWKKYLSALNKYIVENNYEDKIYYYVMNEPQNSDDYNLAAYLSKITKEAAPNLRIAISEEPKPEICENNTYGNCSFDIWMASLQHYNSEYAKQRMSNKGEEVWLYSLPHDPEPFFNPTKLTNQGIHQRIIPWVSWSERIKGWAYYNGGEFFDNGRPNIRLELLREGFEDYEYLYLANGKKHPVANKANAIDASVKSVATDLTNWVKDADALMKLKWDLGKFIENGATGESPILVTRVNRARDEYYINFQDVSGKPIEEPLEVDGKIYMKIGWDAYSTEKFYGWSGSAVGNASRTKSGYLDASGFNELEKSYIYDDYGHINTFTFDLENGDYNITAGVGRPNKNTGDATNVTIEGVKFYDAIKNIPSSEEKTQKVTIADGTLTLTMGTILNSQGQYTFLSYLKIIPID